ncbi:hypothetical protein LSTR_LSTR013917 [Laodelphax striatellus]|uniref:DNA-directed RNA polymerase I subunit RPA49 n=1 Tax=Laodelphax striatellus TaxID=195883 RepID=A0A482X3H0_LAOST|nr:hypothetical protein LSTR_LSTR013917 [Laodelphax striatellus]
MHKCKIIEVSGSNKKLQPTLVEFEHGSLNNNNNVTNMKCDVVFEDDSQSTTYLAWRNSQRSILLKGTKVQPEDQLTQTLLLIRNKKTNKIRVVATDRLVVSNIVNHDGQLASRKTKDDTISKQQVSLMFGSKKAQRHAVLSKKLQINQDIVKSKLETSVADIKVNVDDLNSSRDSSTGHLPPCNVEAKTAEDVYKISDIIPEDVLESLQDIAEQVVEKPPSAPDNEFSQFFVKCITSSPSVLKSTKHLKCLLYVDCLSRFFAIAAKDMKAETLYKMCPYSKYARNYIINTFSQLQKKTRLRPIIMRDKAVAQSLVLLMIVFQYKLPIQLFQLAFPAYKANRLHDFGRALRFSSTTTQTWTLKLPLPTVNSFGGPKKRMKR